ncbi:MAG: hypothetical protein WC708_17145 [Lentisphaeria bacterium]
MIAAAPQTSVHKLRFHEPIRNLPGRRDARTGESDFTLAFARAYVAQFSALHRRSCHRHIACAREIPVNGFGIADLVAVLWPDRLPVAGHRWPSLRAFTEETGPLVRAFELKLGSWRAAMLQAHRYRYYAHSAVVVLPLAVAETASAYLATFRTIHVGLWGFDPDAQRIVVYHTPPPRQPLAPAYIAVAIKKVAKASKALPVP